MIGSLLAWGGLLATFVAAVSLVRPLALLRIRTRKAALGLGGAGLALVAVAMILPAGVRRAVTPESLLDEWMPQWQFGEAHSLRMRATVEQAWQAIHEVTGGEIALMRTLMWVRHPRWPGGDPAPDEADWDRPIVEAAVDGGFRVLARSAESNASRELVLGTVLSGDEATQPAEPDPAAVAAGRDPVREVREATQDPVTDLPEAEWKNSALGRPGNVVAAINFRVHDEGSGWVRVSTGTRVIGTDAAARRRFARYWRIIQPGSRLLRHTWLRAIRERAELGGSAETAAVATPGTAVASAPASLLYAISAGEPGTWQPTQTEIFAVDPATGSARRVFSDDGQSFLLLPPLRSGIPETVLVTNGTRVFGHGRSRSSVPEGPSAAGALWEIFTDGSNRAREVCRVLGQQRSPRKVFVSPSGDRIGYINDIDARWVIFIHETTDGRLLHQIPLEPVLQDGFVRTIGWMPDEVRIFFTGEIGDVHVTSEDSYSRAGSYVMREDGSDVQPVRDEVDGATVRAGFQAIEEMPPSMLGVLPDGRYVFAELQFGSGDRMPTTFYYAADPATGERSDIPGISDVPAPAGVYWSKLSVRGDPLLAFSTMDADSEVVWALDLGTGTRTRVLAHPAGAMRFPYLTVIGWYEE